MTLSSFSSASERARFCTSATGTCSSAPDADLASAPARGGLCRRVMTRPAAPNTAAERRMAPTLCGSVTWSSTMMGRPAPTPRQLFEVGSGNGSTSIRAP